jgi:hypothetical protein
VHNINDYDDFVKPFNLKMHLMLLKRHLLPPKCKVDLLHVRIGTNIAVSKSGHLDKFLKY